MNTFEKKLTYFDRAIDVFGVSHFCFDQISGICGINLGSR